MSFDSLAGRYLKHTSTLRGLVRQTLVREQFAPHLPPPPARIIDVGGGAGHQSIPLAREGYWVTLLDPSEEMLNRANETLRPEDHGVRDRLRLVLSTAEDGSRLVGKGLFDAALCR